MSKIKMEFWILRLIYRICRIREKIVRINYKIKFKINLNYSEMNLKNLNRRMDLI